MPTAFFFLMKSWNSLESGNEVLKAGELTRGFQMG